MELTEETKVITGILGFMWTKFFWEYYLAFRQHKLYKTTTTVPAPLKGVITQETLEKSRIYTSEKMNLILVQDIFSILKSTIIIYYECFHYFWVLATNINPWEDEISTSCIWLIIFNTFSRLTTMPFIGYDTFIIEEKYGFNKQTMSFFIVDQIKLYILEEMVSVASATFLINIIQISGDFFFIWLWLMIGTFIILFDSISPLFDDLTPLPEGELKTSIEALASELKFPLGQIYILACSHRSTHGNAYCAGLFGAKRIVLSDSFFGSDKNLGFTNEEILAVISHELGHWYYNHMIKILLFVEADLFVMLACFALMFSYAPLYVALGFPSTQKPILTGLIAIDSFVMTPYHAFSDVLITALTRSFEYQADAFAGGLGKAPALISTLIRLCEDNLHFPVYDPLFSAWYFSHPTLLERIDALSDTKNK